MKTMIALLLAIASPAFAGNEGPGPLPRGPAPDKLAEVITTCGFCALGYASGVRILTDSTVIRFTTNTRDGEKQEQIATVSAAEAIKLSDLVNKMEISALVDPYAKDPVCADGPMTTYFVYQGGKEQTIAQTAGCHTSVMSNGQGTGLKNLLDAFDRLPR